MVAPISSSVVPSPSSIARKYPNGLRPTAKERSDETTPVAANIKQPPRLPPIPICIKPSPAADCRKPVKSSEEATIRPIKHPPIKWHCGNGSPGQIKKDDHLFVGPPVKIDKDSCADKKEDHLFVGPPVKIDSTATDKKDDHLFVGPPIKVAPSPAQDLVVYPAQDWVHPDPARDECVPDPARDEYYPPVNFDKIKAVSLARNSVKSIACYQKQLDTLAA